MSPSLPPDATIGDRLRWLRNERALTQEQLAELADVSVDVVRKLEQGSRSTARLTTLTKLANALSVSPSRLLDRRPRLNGPENRLVDELRDVVVSPDLLPGIDIREDDGAPTGVDELQRLVHQGWKDYWSGDFRHLAQALPSLVGEARMTERSLGAVATGPLTQAYQLTGLLLVQLGREDLAAVAVERGLTVSYDGEDELQHATLYGTYAWALLEQGRNSEAEKVAVRAAARFEPTFSTATPEQLTVWGRILLYAIDAAAKDGRRDSAADHYRLAQAGAARLPRDRFGNYGDSFGPTQAAVQATRMYTDLDAPDKALAVARRVRREDLYLIRYGRHLLDVAQAQADMRRTDAAIATLKTAKDLSPVWFRHTHARVLVDTLRERQTRMSPVMRELVQALEPH